MKLSTAKKKLWKLVSEYIRRKDATVDGLVECCTCGKFAHWKEMDAGHFVGGHLSYNYFDERNIHCQCTGCNRFRHGALLEYNDFMLKKYGKKVVNDLRQYKVKQWKVWELEELMEEYKKKLSEFN